MNSSVFERLNGDAAVWTLTMWRACWQGAIAVTAVWLLCFLFRKLPHSYRCVLWWLVCLKMLLALSPMAVRLPMLPTGAPVSRVVSTAIQRESLSYVAADKPAIRVSNLEPSKAPARPTWELVAFGMWILGSVLLGVLTLRPLARTRSAARRAIESNDPALLAMATEVAERIGLRKLPKILICEEFGDILTFGAFRPKVLLSKQALEGCSMEEPRMILAHEFAHIQRGDVWLALVPQLVQIVFFFHPLVWLAAKEFNLAREAECDRMAIQSMQIGPAHYGQLLLRLGASQDRTRPLCSLGVSSHFQVLRRRIAMLDHVSNYPSFRPRRSVIAALGLTALLCVAPISLVQGQATAGTAQPVSNSTEATHAAIHKAAVSNAANGKAKPASKTKLEALTRPSEHVGVKATQTVAAQAQTKSTLVFNLQYAKASSVSALLKQVFKAGDIQIVPDERTNLVVVRGGKSTVEEVRSVIENLDQPTPGEHKSQVAQVTRVYALRYGNASDMADVLRASVAARHTASIAVDGRTNSLVVIADVERLADVESLLRQLDRPAEPLAQSQTVTSVVQLRNANAAEVAKILNSLKPGKELVRASSDDYSNSVIVVSSPNALEELKRVISEIDSSKPKR